MLKNHKKGLGIKVSESDIQNTILRYLKLKKVFHYRQNSSAVKIDKRFIRSTSINGLPDIICILEGTYIGLEVKTDIGTLNANQIKTHREIIAAGGLVYVVRSLNDVKAIFEKRQDAK